MVWLYLHFWLILIKNALKVNTNSNMRFGWVLWKRNSSKTVCQSCSFSWASEQSWLFRVNGCVGVYAFMFLNECDWMRDWLFASECECEWVWDSCCLLQVAAGPTHLSRRSNPVHQRRPRGKALYSFSGDPRKKQKQRQKAVTMNDRGREEKH